MYTIAFLPPKPALNQPPPRIIYLQTERNRKIRGNRKLYDGSAMESIRIIGRNKCPPRQNLCWCRTPRPIPKGSRMRASVTNRGALWKPEGRAARRSLRYIWCGGVRYAQAARVGVEPPPFDAQRCNPARARSCVPSGVSSRQKPSGGNT